MVAPAVEGIDLFKIAGRSISGWIPSLKTGTASHIRQPFGSQLEERLLLYLEYHPQVKSYARGDIGTAFATTYRLPIPKHAPFTIGYTFESKPHDYLPDVVETLTNGKPFIAEVGMEDDKRSDRNLAKAEAARRLARLQRGVFWIGTERTLTNTRYGVHDAQTAAQAGGMTLEELERCFYQAIVDDYQQEWDMLRRQRRSVLWEQAVAQSGVPHYLGSPDDLKLLLMKAINRKTPGHGYRVQNGSRLSFQGRWYVCPGLLSRLAGREFEVYYDRRDVGVLYLFVEGQYVGEAYCPQLMGHLHQYGTQCLIVDDAHDLSLEHLMFIKELTDQGRLQYDHPLGLCLVAAGRGNTIPLKEILDQPETTWLQFRRRLDKLEPFCRVAGHTSEEVREILAALETVYQQLFPRLNLRQWGGTIYTWLTQPVLDPTHSGRVTMDYLMKLVTTALEWSYAAGDTEVGAETLEKASSLLVLRRDTLWIIDGAGPSIEVPQPEGTKPTSTNGTEPQRGTVQGNEQQNTIGTVETAEEQVQTSTSSKCTFSRVAVAIDLKRFADSGVTLVECPNCGRTRSLSPVKDILRFKSHDPRKVQTPVIGLRWAAKGKTIWEVVGGESK